MLSQILKSISVVALALFSCLSSAAQNRGTSLSPEQIWTSTSSQFRLRVESSLQPLAINRLHSWTLHLEDAMGQPVVGATIEAEGGMPEHDHGLPTKPQITTTEQMGTYRLEGLRFHMPGDWQIKLVIRTDRATDSILIPLQL
jgi:hypothetical protein